MSATIHYTTLLPTMFANNNNNDNYNDYNNNNN